MNLKETRREIYDGLFEYYIKRYEEELVANNLSLLTDNDKYWIEEQYTDYIFNSLIDSDANPEYPTEVWTFELLGKAFLIIEKEIKKDIQCDLRNLRNNSNV